ncbi:hypothetical protein CBS101457_005162 [Exobasidium rhododendri]|nr:hypothetical protein CBS101457_005162 [Exobasidium rhododendri]
MPSPPPRQNSLDASTRRHRKHSSAASSSCQQSTNEIESSEVVPQQSVSSLYTGLTLGDELSNSSDMTATTPSTALASLDRSSSSTSLQRMPKLRRRTSSISVSKSKSSRKLKDGPSIVISVRNPSSSTSPTISRNNSKRPTSEAIVVPDIQPSELTPGSEAQKTSSKKYHISRTACEFCLEVLRAWKQLFSVIIWPMGPAMLYALTTTFRRAETHQQDLPMKKIKSTAKAVTPVDKTFAEHFKYIVCTSHLLTSKLAISLYDHQTPQAVDESAEEEEDVRKSPSSSRHHHIVTSAPPSHIYSGLHLTMKGGVLFNATCWAVILQAVISRDYQVWLRSTVILISLMWVVLASIGNDESSRITFEVSHQSLGSYSLLDYDHKTEMEANVTLLSTYDTTKITKDMCKLATDLMVACKRFDIECNQTIAAIQEVELVSRGFKLSHPLPPISRIEANLVSPSRLKHDLHTSSAVAMGSSRLSRSSSGGASSGSGWKHHGSRPQSVLFSNHNYSNGRSSPFEPVEVESIRMAPMRKLLVASFEEAKQALQLAQDSLVDLVDDRELELIKEMYELHVKETFSLFDQPLSTPEPWTAPPTTSLFDKRTSWTSITRARLDDESFSSSVDESIAMPGTPQRSTQTVDQMYTFSSNRKRDSVMSETWSAASPTRDGGSSRGGSRLGYVSDKTPSTSTPNHSAASKRLSYVSSTSGNNTPLQDVKTLLSLQTSSPVLGRQNSRRRASLISIGMMEDRRQARGQNVHPTAINSISSGNNTGSKTDAHLIISLKRTFEEMHSIRRRVLCHLLALDFSLQQKTALRRKKRPTKALSYWEIVGQVMMRVTKIMTDLSVSIKQELERDMEMAGKFSEDRNGASGTHFTLTSANEQEDSGLEDRFVAMGQALRSVQVKMRSCAEEMKLKSPPALHGRGGSAPVSGGEEQQTASKAARAEKSEKILETVREDILTLSSEWENALKILQLQRCALDPSSPIGDTSTSTSTMNSSRLDSPQEAEEDALRQWRQNGKTLHRTPDEAKGEEEEVQERGDVMQWTDGQENHADYIDLLLSTATPDHLPLPGMEKVYESAGEVHDLKLQRSTLSREERIQLAKQQRAIAASEATAASPSQANNGIIKELEAVMKNRKTTESCRSTAKKDSGRSYD